VERRKKIKSHLLFFPFLNHTESFAERTYEHDENPHGELDQSANETGIAERVADVKQATRVLG